MNQTMQHYYARTRAWVMRDAHKQRAREFSAEVKQAFTEHPHATGETYLQHLCFTVKMAGRFFYTTTVLLIHGIFPFLLVKAASAQIEIIYKIMRNRVPKDRRDAIDAIDYQV